MQPWQAITKREERGLRKDDREMRGIEQVWLSTTRQFSLNRLNRCQPHHSRRLSLSEKTRTPKPRTSTTEQHYIIRAPERVHNQTLLPFAAFQNYRVVPHHLRQVNITSSHHTVKEIKTSTQSKEKKEQTDWQALPLIVQRYKVYVLYCHLWNHL